MRYDRGRAVAAKHDIEFVVSDGMVYGECALCGLRARAKAEFVLSERSGNSPDVEGAKAAITKFVGNQRICHRGKLAKQTVAGWPNAT